MLKNHVINRIVQLSITFNENKKLQTQNNIQAHFQVSAQTWIKYGRESIKKVRNPPSLFNKKTYVHPKIINVTLSTGE